MTGGGFSTGVVDGSSRDIRLWTSLSLQ